MKIEQARRGSLWNLHVHGGRCPQSTIRRMTSCLDISDLKSLSCVCANMNSTRAVYCSLCRQLGDRYGIFARMTLSYDCTFYALWMMALHKRCPSFQEGRCVVNPMKKCGFCTGGERELRLASALSVIMVYQKVRDNIADDRFLKRLRSYFMHPFVSRMRRKAERDYPELDKICRFRNHGTGSRRTESWEKY